MAQRLLITGANGHLGRRLIARLRTERDIVAAVRSPKAAKTLEGVGADVRILDYRDGASLAAAAQGCDAAVHLVGIIKESRQNRFEDAHEATARALVAVPGLERIVYLSIVGAKRGSSNACLASRAAAEDVLLAGPGRAAILRVAMVLGEGDHASFALRKRALGRLNFAFRAASLEQPIYAGDVVEAIVRVLALDDPPATVDLAGPECLSRRELIRRAAKVLGRRPITVSLPIGLGYALTGLLEAMSANPPATRAMLGVLDHDDRVDMGPVCARLGLQLTPLDEALRRCVGVAHTRT